MDIKIFHRTNPSAKDKSPLSFSFSRGAGTVSGIEQLMQIVLVNLFTDKNTDALNLNTGGGFISTLRHSFSKGEGALASAAQASISKVEGEIIADQSRYSVPSTERLSALRIKSISSFPENGSVSVTIEVINDTGQSATLTL